jgi:hypothetical protein
MEEPQFAEVQTKMTRASMRTSTQNQNQKLERSSTKITRAAVLTVTMRWQKQMQMRTVAPKSRRKRQSRW